jgi:periplasmic protein TonB
MRKYTFTLLLFFGLHFTFSQEVKPNPAEIAENIYNSSGVEVKPEYPGGIQEFYQYISKTYIPPSSKDFKGGKVIVQFVIEKDGSIDDIKVLKDVGFGTNFEAIRVLRMSKKWKPAEQNGKKVRCSYQLPIALNSN